MTVRTHVCKIALNHGRFSPFTNLRQSSSLLPLFVKHRTSSATTTPAAASARKEPSFAESYLVDTLGFSQESALSLSRYLKFKTADKPDLVLSCLREYGFSETQLSQFVRRCPKLLSLNTEKKLSPKLEFFLSKGLSRTELAKLLSANPSLLKTSLENNMVPFYDFFRIFLKSDEKVSGVVVRCPRVIHSFGCYMKTNINHLLENRVPKSKIATLVKNWPSTLALNTEKFNEIVGFVKYKGLNPLNVSFVAAIAVVGSISSPTWEKKVLLYKSWGWSEEDVFGAFKRFPQCMAISESKINAVIDFLINEVGCETSYIAQHPVILAFSLEQRIIPRCSVMKVLLSKGMISLTSLASMLLISVDSFEKKLVTSYGEEGPKLLKIYGEKMNVPK